MMNNIVKKDLTQDIGSRMSGNFVCIRDTLTIREAMSELVRQAGVHDNIATLYVVDAGGVYAGAIDLKDLIIARENDRLADIIRRGYPYVFANERTADCAERIADYEEDSLPVLTEDRHIAGVLTVQELVELVDAWKELLPKAEIIPISATSKFNVDYVMKRVKELLPDSPPYFDKDQWTDKPARFFVTEIIREKILLYYDKEIPYSVEVMVEQFKEEAKKIHISAVIYVERDSQKGIIIVKQGKALKKVATEARRDLERFFGKTIFLETFVKVDKDWRSSDKELRNFGYQLD